MSVGFQTQLGFIQTANIHNGQTYMNYQWYPKHRTIQRIGLETNQNVAYDHLGDRVYHTRTSMFCSPAAQLFAGAVVGQNSDTVGPQNGTC